MATQSVWQRWGTALRTDGRMLIRFLILCAGLFLFARIGSEVVEGDTLSFDRAIITALRQPGDLAVPIGPRWLMLMMRDMTALGGVVVLTLITAIVAGYLLVLRRRATALFVIVAAVSGSLLGTLLKGLFQRPRPDIVAHLVDVSTTSFPSGHAMNSAIIYLTLGSLLARTHEDRRIRIYILTVSILLTLIIGSSRVYLGVHWPTDVLAGWTVGAIWAVLCSTVARRLQARGGIEQAGE